MTAPTIAPRAGTSAAVATVLAAMAAAVLDAGMTNVALPGLVQAFGVSPAEAIGVVTAYQAGLVMALLPLGAVGERFGLRRVFQLSAGLFLAGALAAALARDLRWLLAARLAQGVGGAGIMALGVALLRATVGGERLGAAIGWNALTVALASAAAPSLGALAMAVADWRAVFVLSAPLAAFAIFAAPALPATPGRGGVPDPVSIGLNALAFGLLVLAPRATIAGSGAVTGVVVAGLAALAMLLWRESPKATPLIPFDLLAARPFRLSVAASVCCFTAQSAGLVALPFLLQSQLRLSPLAAGLCITTWPLSVAAAASVAGRLSDRMSTSRLCAIGGTLLGAGLAGCAVASSLAGLWALIPAIALAGVGFGLFQTPNNRNLFLAAPIERSGAAGGLQGAARVSGQAAGASLAAALMTLAPMQAALTAGFGLAAVLALAAAGISLLRGPRSGVLTAP